MDSITGRHSSTHRVNKFIASSVKSDSIAANTDHRVDIDPIEAAAAASSLSSASSSRCEESPAICSCSQQLISPFDCNNNHEDTSNKHQDTDQVPQHLWQQSNSLSAKVYPLICLSPQDRKFLCKTYPINRGHRLSLGGGFRRSCRVMPHHAALRRAESSADSAIML